MITTFSYKPSLVRIDARKFELSDPPTHINTHTHPQIGPITIHCAAVSPARSVLNDDGDEERASTVIRIKEALQPHVRLSGRTVWLSAAVLLAECCEHH